MTAPQSNGTVVSWIPPDVEAATPRRRIPGDLDGATARPGPGAPGDLAGSPVARLAPRSIRQLLDGGFEVLRFRFATTAPITAMFVLPLVAAPIVVTAVWSARITTDAFPFTGVGSPDAFETLQWLSVWAWAGGSLAHTFLAVAVGRLVAEWLVGRDPARREVVGFVLRRTPVVIGAWLLAAVVKVVAAIPCGLGLIAVLPMLSLLGPVLGAEQLGAWNGLTRAVRLGRRVLGRLVAISAGFAAVSYVVGVAVVAAGALLAGFLGLGATEALVVSTALRVVASMLLAVVLVGTTTLTYVDARVRTEGLDLELGATRVLDRDR